MANRRWLNDRKTMGFESSKKSVNIRVHDAFFLLFFIFFIKRVPVPLSPPVLPPLFLHAHTPFGIQESRFSLRRDRAAGRGEIVRNRANATEQPFCSIHRLATGSLSCVQHASKHARNPVKSTTHALHAHELTNRENP